MVLTSNAEIYYEYPSAEDGTNEELQSKIDDLDLGIEFYLRKNLLSAQEVESEKVGINAVEVDINNRVGTKLLNCTFIICHNYRNNKCNQAFENINV